MIIMLPRAFCKKLHWIHCEAVLRHNLKFNHTPTMKFNCLPSENVQSQKERSLPTTMFRGRAVSLRECMSMIHDTSMICWAPGSLHSVLRVANMAHAIVHKCLQMFCQWSVFQIPVARRLRSFFARSLWSSRGGPSPTDIPRGPDGLMPYDTPAFLPAGPM